MKGLVVYDSVYGNTEQIARRIGEALGSRGGVETLRASEVDAKRFEGLDLLVVGSPTRGWRPTETVTHLLKAVGAGGLAGTKAAAFDTRIAAEDAPSGFVRFILRVGSYAAPPIARRLAKCGASLVEPPEGFYVRQTEGPLKEGELDRAARWAERIAAEVG